MNAATVLTLITGLPSAVSMLMNSAGVPLLLVVIVSAIAVVVRAALPELRWWLALRGTAPGDRPDIIRALGTARARPRARGRP